MRYRILLLLAFVSGFVCSSLLSNTQPQSGIDVIEKPDRIVILEPSLVDNEIEHTVYHLSVCNGSIRFSGESFDDSPKTLSTNKLIWLVKFYKNDKVIQYSATKE